jgi:hypothetical protein
MATRIAGIQDLKRDCPASFTGIVHFPPCVIHF